MYESCVFFFDLKVSDCASWVQAWGSIAAIVAAAWFTWWQHRLELKRASDAERELTRRRIGVIAQAASDAEGVLADAVLFARLQQITLNRAQHLTLRERLGKSQELLSAISKPDLPNFRLAQVVIDLESALASAKGLIDTIHASTPNQQHLLDGLQRGKDVANHSVGMLMEAFDSPFFLPADAEKHPPVKGQ